MKNHYKFWIVFSLVIVFAAGVTGGILLEKNLLHKKPEKTARRRNSVRFPTLDIMAQELNLTAEQTEQIREIFRQNEERLKAMRGQIQKQFSSLRILLKKEIKDVLSEEQNLKFEAMIEKYLSQRREESERRKKSSKRHRKDKGEKR